MHCRKIEKRREDKVLAKRAADKDARKAALIIKKSNEAPAELPANKETDPDSNSSLAHTPINNNTYEEPNNGKEDEQEKAKKPDKKATETDPDIDPIADSIPFEEPKAPEPEDILTDLQIDNEEDKEEDGEFLLDTEGGTYDLDDKVLPSDIKDRIYGDKPKTPHAPYPPLPPQHSADWTSKKSNHIHKPSSLPITHPPSTTHHNAMSKSMITPSKNLNNMATDPVHEELACKEKAATARVNNVDKYVPRATASHWKSIPPFLSMMFHRKMPLYSLF